MVWGQIDCLTHNCFMIEEGFEDVDAYCPGGFCPLHLGDRLDGATYTVVYKLGSGSTSTVWLARDNRYGTDSYHHPYRYVALKVLRAEYYAKAREVDIHTHFQESFKADRPAHVNEKLGGALVNHPGIIRLIHTFTIQSPCGSHHALVLPVVRPLGELNHLHNPDFPTSQKLLQHYPSIVRQISEAVAFVHKHGVIHGDIQPGNIGYLCENLTDRQVQGLEDAEMRSTWLWRYPDEPDSAVNAITKDLGHARNKRFFDPIPDYIAQCIPKYLICNSGWVDNEPEFQEYLDDPHVVLMDFSWSLTKDTPQTERPHVAIPRSYRAPEYKFPVHQLAQPGDIEGDKNYEKGRYHGDLETLYGDMGEAGDVWAMGSTILKLAGGDTPYPSYSLNPAERALQIDPHVPDGWERIDLFRQAIDKLGGSFQPANEEFWRETLDWPIQSLRTKLTKEHDGAELAAIHVATISSGIEFARYILKVDLRRRPSAADVVERLSNLIDDTGKFRRD